MEQLKSLADSRLRERCAYCGGAPDTRDHVPSRILLDEPYPANLPVVLACRGCNEGFSKDEEYVACLIDCVRVGSANPGPLHRTKIARILSEKPALARMLDAARTVEEGQVRFAIDPARVRNVLKKLVVGHASFELEERPDSDELRIDWAPLPSLDESAGQRFEAAPERAPIWPEIGSRAMQRMRVVSVTLAPVSGIGEPRQVSFLSEEDWIDVQEGQYRYLAALTDDGRVLVRVVLSEYLACEVSWGS